jgi:hypothetical protein
MPPEMVDGGGGDWKGTVEKEVVSHQSGVGPGHFAKGQRKKLSRVMVRERGPLYWA